MNQKRKFTPEFKKEAVALVTEQDYTVAKAAASLGISDKTLHTWVTLARNQSDSMLSDDERAELKRLRKENRELRLEKEILKALLNNSESCCFAKPVLVENACHLRCTVFS